MNNCNVNFVFYGYFFFLDILFRLVFSIFKFFIDMGEICVIKKEKNFFKFLCFILI